LGLRVVHTINGECEIFLQKSRDNFVKIRVTEPDSADFEIEGSVDALRELFSILNNVITHVDSISEESN
jgi:hypothetical protein